MQKMRIHLQTQNGGFFFQGIFRFALWSRKILLRCVAIIFGPLFAHIARSGYGSSICLKLGFLPVPVYGHRPTPVHFYSPIPQLQDLRRRKVWDRPSELPTIDFSSERQRAFLQTLGKSYGSECRWTTDVATEPTVFTLANDSFSFGCAASLYSMIRYAKPQRIMEVGSGNSTKIIAQALAKNQTEGSTSEYTIIDPYAVAIVKERKIPYTTLKELPVEQIEVGFFEQLQANDILFIDSGHVVRIGSDVNYLFLEILPRLQPGVIIHVHDINLPREVPEIYATNEVFRQFWTEQYLLQAFLCYNREFSVLLAMSYLMTNYPKEIAAAFPHYDPTRDPKISGSFWFQRRPLLTEKKT